MILIKRIDQLEGKISQLPATQRELLGIERKFTLSNTMYNYLQEKRSEALITKASNEPDNEVIDIARDLGELSCFPEEKPELYDCHCSGHCFTCCIFPWVKIILTIRSLSARMLKILQIFLLLDILFIVIKIPRQWLLNHQNHQFLNLSDPLEQTFNLLHREKTNKPY